MTRAECFVDTNTLIHFKPLDQVDWRELTNAGEVVLTIPSTVIQELDEKKELGKTLRLRKRAQDALRRINEWRRRGECPAIREGVTLRLLAEEPLPEWKALRLDPEVPDDRIIAALLTQRLAPDHAVFLVTADVGPRLKCEPRGIPVITLPEEYRQPDLMGEHEREVFELQQRLAVLEQREPKLTLELAGETGRGPRIETELGYPASPSEQEIEHEVRDEESRLAKMIPAGGPVDSRTVFSLALLDERDLKRFKEAIPGYLKQYRAYLEERRAYQMGTALTVKLACVVSNGGRAPAEGLRIALHVPNGPDVLDEEHVLRAPVQPERPERPRTTAELIVSSLSFRMPDLLGQHSYLRTPNVAGESRGPRITKTNSYRIEYRHRELQHGFEVTFDPFYCVFADPEAVRSFSMDYEIHAKNLAEPTTGRLDLLVRIRPINRLPG